MSHMSLHHRLRLTACEFFGSGYIASHPTQDGRCLGWSSGIFAGQSVYERIPKDRRKDETSCVQHPVISLSPTGHYL